MINHSPARAVATKTLLVIEQDPEILAGETLAKLITEAQLSNEDSRLARNIVFGVLRTALTLDVLYSRYLTRGNTAKLATALRTLLRVSAFQHYYLSRIPAYAIVNDAIEIGRAVLHLKPREIGFLNAVLRKVVAEQAPPESSLPQSNKATALSVRYSFPPDLVRLFIAKYGGQKTADIMAHCNHEPPLTIRINTLRSTREELTQHLQETGFSPKPAILAPEALIVSPISEIDGTSIFDSHTFRDGLFYVQDEGSQMVAHIAAPFAQGRILDLCAAPGGKTTHLAELTGGRFHITATDSSARRLALLRENITRLHTPAIEVIPLDEIIATSHNTTPDNQFNLILVDAPCSGLGTVRRNPEIRYRITDASLARHQQRQLEVLTTAASLTAPNGTIVYSTCSISTRENRGVVDKFLKTHPAWSLAENNSTHTTWPAHLEIDGFEATILRRQ